MAIMQRAVKAPPAQFRPIQFVIVSYRYCLPVPGISAQTQTTGKKKQKQCYEKHETEATALWHFDGGDAQKKMQK